MTGPEAMYRILAEQTNRLCQPEGNVPATRKLIRKLVIHFGGSKLPESVRRTAEANLAAVDPGDPATYALKCLAGITHVIREEEQHQALLAKFDGLADSVHDLELAISTLDPKGATQ